jgi:hypothetical protein
MIGIFSRRSRSGRRSRGQALVEFAFTAPIFFVLLLGLLEGGRYVFYSETLNHAAREGVRYAIIHGAASQPASERVGPGSPDPSGNAVKQVILDAAVIGDPENVTIPDPVYSPNNNRRGSTVTVTLTYTYTPVVSILGPITVDAEATLVVNN